VRVRVKAPGRRRANGPVSCILYPVSCLPYGIILYYPVSCVFGSLILLSLCAGPLILLALSPHPHPLPFPSSSSLDCTRSASPQTLTLCLCPCCYPPTHLLTYSPTRLPTSPPTHPLTAASCPQLHDMLPSTLTCLRAATLVALATRAVAQQCCRSTFCLCLTTTT
jgi:hypothetical protein